MYKNAVDAVLAEDYFGSSEDVEWALEYLQRQYPEKVYGINMLNRGSGRSGESKAVYNHC